MLVVYVRDNLPARADLTWLRKGALFARSGLPSWKFNAGEKLWFWIVIVTGFALSVSGLLLDFSLPCRQYGSIVDRPSGARRRRLDRDHRRDRPRLSRVQSAWKAHWRASSRARSISRLGKEHHSLWAAEVRGATDLQAPSGPSRAEAGGIGTKSSGEWTCSISSKARCGTPPSRSSSSGPVGACSERCRQAIARSRDLGRRSPAFGALRSIVACMIPARPLLGPPKVLFVTLAGYAFHLGLFALLLFGAPHVTFVEERVLGFGWTPLPPWGFVIAAEIAFAGLLLLWVRPSPRSGHTEMISRADDHLSAGLTFAVMLTGCFALGEQSAGLRALHMLSVNVWLIYFPLRQPVPRLHVGIHARLHRRALRTAGRPGMTDLEHFPEKWAPVFRKGNADREMKLERSREVTHHHVDAGRAELAFDRAVAARWGAAQQCDERLCRRFWPDGGDVPSIVRSVRPLCGSVPVLPHNG